VHLTPIQIHTLKTFFTTTERNLGHIAAQYGEPVLVRTCYEKGTDAAFEQILSKYREVKFASICDDKDRYARNRLTQPALQFLPFLVEITRFVRCSLMPKEHQDKILHLSRNTDCLRENKVEVDRLLLMDDTNPAFGTLAKLSLPDLQRWSSIVGVICVVDRKAMDCGLVKLCAFDDQGQPVWSSRISPKGLSGFVAGMKRGESIWQLRLALRQYESGSGGQYSTCELSTEEIKPSPSSAYDTLRMIAKRDQADRQKLDQDGENQDALTATLAGDQEIPVEELDVEISEDSDPTANETVRDGAECVNEILRELRQKLENPVADKERAETEEAVTMAYVSEEASHNARLIGEADLQAATQTVEQLKIDLARKFKEDRAEYARKLSECVAAKDLAVEQKEAAILHELSLGEELARERGQVAEMQKMLEAKDRKIIEADDHENRITQRLQEEIMAKEKAMNAKDVLASQWSQVLADAGRQISDLREQLMTGQSECTKASEQNELLTGKLVQAVTTNEELRWENQRLESEWQQTKQELSVKEEASKISDFHLGNLEEKIRTEIKSKQQIIDGLGNTNEELKVQRWKFATRLAKEIGNKDRVMREKVELLEQLHEDRKKINASHEYAASVAAREARTSRELEFKDRTIKHSEEFISKLKAEIELAREACLSYKAQLAAADRRCGVAKDATIQMEKGLQSQKIRHIEEMKQAQHAIEQVRKAKEEAFKQVKSTKKDLEGKLSGEITLKTKLENDLRLVRVQLASSQQRYSDLEKDHAREHSRLSAQLQQALKQQKLAEENSGILAARLQARDEEGADVRARLERECQILTEELAEAWEATAKLEMENKEDRARMAGLLRSADITARDERIKCERAEEELTVWRDQDGVITLD
jgi:hypothetical protein